MSDKNDNTTSNIKRDMMIGIALVIFGGFRLYNRLQTEEPWSFRAIFTFVFIGYGIYLIIRYFQHQKEKHE